MMKKLFSILLVVAMVAALAACGAPAAPAATEAPAAPAATEAPKVEAPAEPEVKEFDVIWVTCSTQSEFWQYQQIGMENAALDMEEKYGVKINFTVVGPATEAETEAYIRAFENAVASGPDAIISATQVPDSTWSVAKEATDRGIVVNFTNCGLEPLDSNEYSDCYNQFYTTVSSDVGDMAGKIFLEMLEANGMDKAGIVAMEFSNVNPSLQPRMDNFQAYVEGQAPDIDVLDCLFNNNDLQRAQADIENQIAANGDKLIGIYGANNISSDGIAIAVENAGIKDQVIAIGVDSDPVAIKALEDGYLDCLIVQDAYGQGYASMVNAIETLLQGKNPETEQKIAMPPVAVTTTNMHEPEYAALLDPTLLKK